MDQLKFPVEDRKADNLFKLYIYIIGGEFRTEKEHHIKITNSIFMEIYKKECVVVDSEDNGKKEKVVCTDLVKLSPVKDTIRINQLKGENNCFSDSRGIVLVPDSNTQKCTPILFCSVRDENKSILFEFHYTPTMELY